MLFFEYVQNSEARRARNRVSPEGAEELHSVVEACRDFWASDNRGEGESISDWLAEDHNVRNNVLRFESPEVRAQAAETDLHFVGDADAARCADVLVGFGEISGWKNDLAGDTRQRFGDVGRDAAALCVSVPQNLGNMLSVF